MTDGDRPTLGILLRLLSGVLFAGMAICVKAVSKDIPLGEIVFFRSAFAFIPLVIFLWVRREFPQGLATKRPLEHLLRASLGAAAMFASFAALARLTLAEAILIAQLTPILMALAAVWLLGERFTIWRIGGLALGFVGVVAMVLPEIEASHAPSARLTGLALAVLSAVLAALALILVRSLNKTESPGAIALYFVLASMLAALMTLSSAWALPNGWALIMLIGAGLFGGFAHIAMTLAFRYAEATRLAPFEYVALLWPLLADLLIFKLAITSSFLIAAPLVLFGAAIAAAEKKQSVHQRPS